LTYYYEPGADSAYWTPDMAVCYILGPMIGAYFAGNLYNFQKLIEMRMKLGDLDDSDEEDAKVERASQFRFSLNDQVKGLKLNSG